MKKGEKSIRLMGGSGYKISLAIIAVLAIGLAVLMLVVMPAMEEKETAAREILSIEYPVGEIGMGDDLSKVYVSVSYSDGTSEEVSIADMTCEGLDVKATGTQQVSLSYGGFEQILPITVRSIDCVYSYAASTGGRIEGETTQSIPAYGSGNSVVAIAEVGYTFTGWNDGYQQEERRDTNVVQNMVLVANFQKEIFTVVFRYPDGTVTREQLVSYNESPSKVPVATDIQMRKYGYVFTGWEVDFSHVTSDLTIDAVYEKNATDVLVDVSETVKGVEMGTTDLPSEGYYPKGEKAILIASPYDGRQFSGWSIKDANGNWQTLNNLLTIDVKNVELSGGNVVTFTSAQVGDSGQYSLSFTPTSSTELIEVKANMVFDESTVIFYNAFSGASKKNNIERTVKLNAGDKLTETDLKVPDEADASGNIIGYTFLGWSVEGKSATDYVTVDTVFEQDTTLVAQWKKKYYKLYFITTDPSVTGIPHNLSTDDGHYSVGYQTTVAGLLPPTNPEKPKYFFIGWYLVGEGGAITDMVVDEDFLINERDVRENGGRTGIMVAPVFRPNFYTLTIEMQGAGSALLKTIQMNNLIETVTTSVPTGTNQILEINAYKCSFTADVDKKVEYTEVIYGGVDTVRKEYVGNISTVEVDLSNPTSDILVYVRFTEKEYIVSLYNGNDRDDSNGNISYTERDKSSGIQVQKNSADFVINVSVEGNTSKTFTVKASGKFYISSITGVQNIPQAARSYTFTIDSINENRDIYVEYVAANLIVSLDVNPYGGGLKFDADDDYVSATEQRGYEYGNDAVIDALADEGKYLSALKINGMNVDLYFPIGFTVLSRKVNGIPCYTSRELDSLMAANTYTQAEISAKLSSGEWLEYDGFSPRDERITYIRVSIDNITGDKTVSGTFSDLSYSFTVGKRGQGTLDTVTQSVAYNGDVSVSATTEGGYYVKSYILNGQETVFQDKLDTQIVTVSNIQKDNDLVVVFALTSFDIVFDGTENLGQNSTVTHNSENTERLSASFNVEYNSSNAFRIDAVSGYYLHEIKVNGNAVLMPNGATSQLVQLDNVQSDYIITVACTKLSYTVSAVVNNPAFGSVTGTGIYHYGETVRLAVNPTEGYVLRSTTEGTISIGGDEIILSNILGNKSLTLVFEKKTYMVSPSVVSGGAISAPHSVSYGESFNALFAAGLDRLLTAVEVSGQSVNLSGEKYASFVLNLTATDAIAEYGIITLSGTFEEAELTPAGEVQITQTSGGSLMGRNSVGALESGMRSSVIYNVYNEGNSSVIITADNGYFISKLGSTTYGGSPAAGDFPRELFFTLDAAVPTVEVVYSLCPYDLHITTETASSLGTTTITVADTENGSYSALTSASVDQYVRINFSPTVGNEIKTLLINDEFITITDEMKTLGYYCYTGIASEQFVRATYGIKTFTPLVTNFGNGSLTFSSDPYVYGEELVLKIVPNLGYELSVLTINNQPIAIDAALLSTHTYTLAANSEQTRSRVEVQIQFSRITYNINITPHGFGSVGQLVGTGYYGETFALSITADENYYISMIKVGGISVELSPSTLYSYTKNSYTSKFVSAEYRQYVTQDIEIDVYFDINVYSITVLKTVNGTTTANLSGSESGLNITKINHGEDVRISMVADVGYNISALYINGVSISGFKLDEITDNNNKILDYIYENVDTNLVIRADYNINYYRFGFETINDSLNFASIDTQNSSFGTFAMANAGYTLENNVYSGIYHGENFKIVLTPITKNGYYITYIRIRYVNPETNREHNVVVSTDGGKINPNGGTYLFSELMGELASSMVGDVAMISVHFTRKTFTVTAAVDVAPETKLGGAIRLVFSHPNDSTKNYDLYSESYAYSLVDDISAISGNVPFDFSLGNGVPYLLVVANGLPLGENEINLSLAISEFGIEAEPGQYIFKKRVFGLVGSHTEEVVTNYGQVQTVYTWIMEYGMGYTIRTIPEKGYSMTKFYFIMNGVINDKIKEIRANSFTGFLQSDMDVRTQYEINKYSVEYSFNVINERGQSVDNLEYNGEGTISLNVMETTVNVLYQPEEGSMKITLPQIIYGSKLTFIATPNYENKGYYIAGIFVNGSRAVPFTDKNAEFSFIEILGDQNMSVVVTFEINRYNLTSLTYVTDTAEDIADYTLSSAMQDSLGANITINGSIPWGYSRDLIVKNNDGYSLTALRVNQNGIWTTYTENELINVIDLSGKNASGLKLNNIKSDIMVQAYYKRKPKSVYFFVGELSKKGYTTGTISADIVHNIYPSYENSSNIPSTISYDAYKDAENKVYDIVKFSAFYFDEFMFYLNPNSGYELASDTVMIRLYNVQSYDSSTKSFVWSPVLLNSGSPKVFDKSLESLSYEGRSLTLPLGEVMTSDLVIFVDFAIKTYPLSYSCGNMGTPMDEYMDITYEVGKVDGSGNETFSWEPIDSGDEIEHFSRFKAKISAPYGYKLDSMIINRNSYDYELCERIENATTRETVYTYHFTFTVNDDLLSGQGNTYISLTANLDVISYVIQSYIDDVKYMEELVHGKSSNTISLQYTDIGIHGSDLVVNPILAEGFEIKQFLISDTDETEYYSGLKAILDAKQARGELMTNSELNALARYTAILNAYANPTSLESGTATFYSPIIWGENYDSFPNEDRFSINLTGEVINQLDIRSADTSIIYLYFLTAITTHEATIGRTLYSYTAEPILGVLNDDYGINESGVVVVSEGGTGETITITGFSGNTVITYDKGHINPEATSYKDYKYEYFTNVSVKANVNYSNPERNFRFAYFEERITVNGSYVWSEVIHNYRGIQLEDDGSLRYQVRNLSGVGVPNRVFRAVFYEVYEATIYVMPIYKYVSGSYVSSSGIKYLTYDNVVAYDATSATSARFTAENTTSIVEADGTLMKVYIFKLDSGTELRLSASDDVSANRATSMDFYRKRGENDYAVIGGIKSEGYTIKGKFESYMIARHPLNYINYEIETIENNTGITGGSLSWKITDPSNKDVPAKLANGVSMTAAKPLDTVRVTAIPKQYYRFNELFVKKVNEVESFEKGQLTYYPKNSSDEWVLVAYVEKDANGNGYIRLTESAAKYDISLLSSSYNTFGSASFEFFVTGGITFKFSFYRTFSLNISVDYENYSGLKMPDNSRYNVAYSHPEDTDGDSSQDFIYREPTSNIFRYDYDTCLSLSIPASTERYQFIGWYVNGSNLYRDLATLWPLNTITPKINLYQYSEERLDGLTLVDIEERDIFAVNIVAKYVPVFDISIMNELFFYNYDDNHFNSWDPGLVSLETVRYIANDTVQLDPTIYDLQMYADTETISVGGNNTSVQDSYRVTDPIFNGKVSQNVWYSELAKQAGSKYTIANFATRRMYSMSETFRLLQSKISDIRKDYDTWLDNTVTLSVTTNSGIDFREWQYYNWATGSFERIPYTSGNEVNSASKEKYILSIRDWMLIEDDETLLENPIIIRPLFVKIETIELTKTTYYVKKGIPAPAYDGRHNPFLHPENKLTGGDMLASFEYYSDVYLSDGTALGYRFLGWYDTWYDVYDPNGLPETATFFGGQQIKSYVNGEPQYAYKIKLAYDYQYSKALSAETRIRKINARYMKQWIVSLACYNIASGIIGNAPRIIVANNGKPYDSTPGLVINLGSTKDYSASNAVIDADPGCYELLTGADYEITNEYAVSYLMDAGLCFDFTLNITAPGTNTSGYNSKYDRQYEISQFRGNDTFVTQEMNGIDTITGGTVYSSGYQEANRSFNTVVNSQPVNAGPRIVYESFGTVNFKGLMPYSRLTLTQRMGSAILKRYNEGLYKDTVSDPYTAMGLAYDSNRIVLYDSQGLGKMTYPLIPIRNEDLSDGGSQKFNLIPNGFDVSNEYCYIPGTANTSRAGFSGLDTGLVKEVEFDMSPEWVFDTLLSRSEGVSPNWSGDTLPGCKSNPYMITDRNKLRNIDTKFYRNNDNSVRNIYFRLKNDINVGGFENGTSGVAWVPICYTGEGFNGILQGNGKKIVGMYVSGGNNVNYSSGMSTQDEPTNCYTTSNATTAYSYSSNGYGLFAKAVDANISDLVLDTATMHLDAVKNGSGNKDRVTRNIGIIAAQAKDTTIKNITVSTSHGGTAFDNQISGTTDNYNMVINSGGASALGLICGRMDGGLIENVNITTNVYISAGNGSCGLIVGVIDDGEIKNVRYTSGEYFNFSKGAAVGGLVGYATSSTISDSYINSTAQIGTNDSSESGGLVGIIQNASSILDGEGNSKQNIVNCYYQGLSNSRITAMSSFATGSFGALAGNSAVGGVVGKVMGSAIVDGCTVKGRIYARTNLFGGIVGVNFGATVRNCFITDISNMLVETQQNMTGIYGGIAGANVLYSGGTYGLITDCGFSDGSGKTQITNGLSSFTVFQEGTYNNFSKGSGGIANLTNGSTSFLAVGGVVGYNTSRLYNSYAKSASIMVPYRGNKNNFISYIGGVAGYNDVSSFADGRAISSCFARGVAMQSFNWIWSDTGAVTNGVRTYMGGIAGATASNSSGSSDREFSIRYCYALENTHDIWASAYGSLTDFHDYGWWDETFGGKSDYHTPKNNNAEFKFSSLGICAGNSKSISRGFYCWSSISNSTNTLLGTTAFSGPVSVGNGDHISTGTQSRNLASESIYSTESTEFPLFLDRCSTTVIGINYVDPKGISRYMDSTIVPVEANDNSSWSLTFNGVPATAIDRAIVYPDDRVAGEHGCSSLLKVSENYRGIAQIEYPDNNGNGIKMPSNIADLWYEAAQEANSSGDVSMLLEVSNMISAADDLDLIESFNDLGQPNGMINKTKINLKLIYNSKPTKITTKNGPDGSTLGVGKYGAFAGMENESYYSTDGRVYRTSTDKNTLGTPVVIHNASTPIRIVNESLLVSGQGSAINWMKPTES